jgi:XTP/dITP diphosphohydrolase
MELIFATNNRHKAEEIQQMLPASISVLTLEDVGVDEEIPEQQDTLEGNASDKSRYIYKRLSKNCFADDTGLEVDALEGAPGVYSARYAGSDKDPEANMDKLLEQLKDEDNRRARFRTVISLILDGEELFFEGVVEGHILREKRGDEGFGYDPVFMPEGSSLTFAQMPMATKNRISHRSRAIKKLANYLNQYQNRSQ